MTNNSQSTLLLYCCEDVKSYRSGGDTVPLNLNIAQLIPYNLRPVAQLYEVRLD